MTPRTASRVAWTAWGFAVALIVPTLLLAIANGGEQWEPYFNTIALFMTLSYATVGALIASRQRRNPIGWLFLLIALTFAMAGLSDNYVIYGVETAPGPLPGLVFAAWLQNFVPFVPFAVIPIVLLLFPTGSVPSPRWRPVIWASVGGPLLATAGLVLRPGQAGGSVTLPNPTGVVALEPVIGVALTIAGATSVGAALLSVIGLGLRFRRSRGEQRQQLRWLVYVAATAAALISLGFVIDFASNDTFTAIGDLIFVAFVTMLAVGVPAACGIAVLKYRLYELDVVLKKTVVFGVLTVFVASAYALVVIGIPSLVFGAGGGARNVIPFVAAAVLALVFQPVRRWAGRLGNRLVYGKRATPYEVLAEFSSRLASEFSAEDVLPRMARMLGEGTGATAAAVWLRVGGRLRREAAWPSAEDDAAPVALAGDDLPSLPASDRAFAVRHRGELLGALAVRNPRGETFTPAQEELIENLASQAALVLRNVRLIEELRASRQRIVAAQDEERRRLERNIHDGAQQQLVALAVKLRLAETVAERDPAKAKQLIAQVKEEAGDALDNLRDLARGIYPPLLADKGLAAALEAQARKVPVPVRIEANGVGRYAQEAETAAYFCVLEALQNVAKYADAARATVRLWTEDGHLAFSVEDDGRGFDPATTPRGSGLQNMADRLDALGGSLEIRSVPGRGTAVTGRIPVPAGGRG